MSTEGKKDFIDMQATLVSVIKTAMSFRGIDEIYLAEYCGVSCSYIKQVLNCKRAINFILLAKIQKALCVKFEVKAIQK